MNSKMIELTNVNTGTTQVFEFVQDEDTGWFYSPVADSQPIDIHIMLETIQCEMIEDQAVEGSLVTDDLDVITHTWKVL